MDRLEAMETFVAVAELGGFGKAARRLRTSPARVTRLVAFLEDALHVELFHRTTRHVALTEAGARRLEAIREVVAAAKTLERAPALDDAPAGRLAITAPLAFGRLHVAPLIADLVAAFPAVRPELILVDRVVDLVAEGLDAAIRIGALGDSALKARALGATRRVVVASPAYLARHRAPRRPADLARHATICTLPLAWRFPKHRVKIAPAITTTSTDATVELAVRGAGLAQVLAYQAADAIRAGRLVVVLAAHEPPPSPISLVYPARRASPNVRALIDLAATANWSFVDL